MCRSIAALAALMWASASVNAQSSAPLRLADVVTQARQLNPEIRAAQKRIDAAAAIPRRVSAYDDPMFSYESWNAPESLRIDQADNNIFRLSQKIPFPGKRALAGEVAQRDVDVSRRAAEAVSLDVINAVKRAYFDLWGAHERLDVYQREKSVSQHLAAVAEQNYAVGSATQTDALRAQMELTRLVNRITTQALAIDSAGAELNALLSRAPDAPLARPENPPPPGLGSSLESLTSLALQRRPEIGVQAAMLARERQSIDLARRNFYPDFEFSVARFANYGQRDGFGFIASVSIPLAFRDKYAAAVDESSALFAVQEAEQRRVEDRIRREVAQAFWRARAAQLQHELLVTTHIPQSEQTLRVTQSAYESAAIGFLPLLEVQSAIESTHLEHVEAAVEFEKAFADLERAVGEEIPR